MSTPHPSSGGKASTTDRRRHPRFDCKGVAQVVLPNTGLRFMGLIRDLSLSGCFIEATCNLERGTLVELQFETLGVHFRATGNVVKLEARRGVGIAFQPMTERREHQIASLVRELEERANRRAADHLPPP